MTIRSTFRDPVLVAALSISGTASANDVIADFAHPEEAAAWRVVNDGVMGGLSESRIVTESDSTAIFTGILSLENNGGFCSVRRILDARFPDDVVALVLHVRGDGRRYQLRLRTDGRLDGVAYRATFTTMPGEWTRIELPIEAFDPTFRGQRVPGAPVLRPADIRQVGLLLGDKRAGVFALEVRDIQVRREPIGEALDDGAVPRSELPRLL